MAKQTSTPALPDDVRELASKALTETHGLAMAALVLHEGADGSHLSVELAAAVKHMLRRIAELSDSVLFPLVQTGGEGVYDADDFERMKELLGEE